MTQLLTAILSLAFLAISPLLLGVPLSPDTPHSWRHIFGLVLLFISWIFSLVNVGELMRRYLKITPSLVSQLGLGSIAFALVAALLGHLRLFFDIRAIYFAIICAGPILVALTQIKHKHVALWRKEKIDWHVPLVITLGFFILLFLEACAPWPAIQPLAINLAATRGWINAGGIKFLPDQPLAFSASIWDYLYFWPHLLLGGRGELSLALAQLFAQWTHVVLGVGITIFALQRILLSMAEGNQGTAWLAVLAGIVAPALASNASLAVNDWGAIAWVLFGFSLAHQEKRFAIGAFILGCGVAANFNNIYFAVPLVLMIYVSHRELKEIEFLKRVVLWFAIPLALFFARNLGYTGTLLQTLHREVKPSAFFLFIDQSPFIPLALIAPLFFWFIRKEWNRSGYFVIALWFGLIWFTWIFGKDGDVRAMAVGIPLLAGLGAISLGRVVQSYRADLTHNKLYYGILSAILLVSSMSWYKQMHLSHLKNLQEMVYSHPAGRTEAWIRHNVDPSALIVSLGEPRLYYLSGHRVVRVGDLPEFDRAVRDKKTLREKLEFLEAKGTRYILDSTELMGVEGVHRPFLEEFWKEMTSHRPAILFQSPESRVLDLDVLLKRIRRHG